MLLYHTYIRRNPAIFGVNFFFKTKKIKTSKSLIFYYCYRQNRQSSNNLYPSIPYLSKSSLKYSNSNFLKGIFFFAIKKGLANKICFMELLNIIGKYDLSINSG